MNDAFGENSALGPWWARQGLNLRPHPCEGCALPLSYAPVPNDVAAADVRKPDVHSRCGADCNGVLCIGFRPMQNGPRWKRSEERRVGKECVRPVSSRWAP